MKFTDAPPKKKVKPKKVEVDYTESEARVIALMPPELKEWYDIHNQCGKGMTTSAYLSMQWANSRNYHEVLCGCGSSAVMKTRKSKVEIQGE